MSSFIRLTLCPLKHQLLHPPYLLKLLMHHTVCMQDHTLEILLSLLLDFLILVRLVLYHFLMLQMLRIFPLHYHNSLVAHDLISGSYLQTNLIFETSVCGQILGSTRAIAEFEVYYLRSTAWNIGSCSHYTNVITK